MSFVCDSQILQGIIISCGQIHYHCHIWNTRWKYFQSEIIWEILYSFSVTILNMEKDDRWHEFNLHRLSHPRSEPESSFNSNSNKTKTNDDANVSISWSVHKLKTAYVQWCQCVIKGTSNIHAFHHETTFIGQNDSHIIPLAVKTLFEKRDVYYTVCRCCAYKKGKTDAENTNVNCILMTIVMTIEAKLIKKYHNIAGSTRKQSD